MEGDFYERRVYPIMYNYLSDKKYFQRNASIALGNTRDEAYVGDLEKAMQNPEPLVRAHAAWGLGRIGGVDAKAALERFCSGEAVASVKEELEFALLMN